MNFCKSVSFTNHFSLLLLCLKLGVTVTRNYLHFLGKVWEMVALVKVWIALALLEMIFSLLERNFNCNFFFFLKIWLAKEKFVKWTRFLNLKRFFNLEIFIIRSLNHLEKVLDFLIIFSLDNEYLGLKELYLKIRGKLDFWTFVEFLEVWA